MGEPVFRKPIFGAVWRYPEADPRRLQRVGRRGLLRLAALVPLTLTLVSLLAISIVYAATGISLTEAMLIGFFLASATVFVLRGWMLGTFVNGNGFKIVTLLKTTSGLWRDTYEVASKSTIWKIAGIPIGIKSQRVVLISPQGNEIYTHVFIGSVDTIFTRERFDVLFQLLRRWGVPE
jgi:hypothetical protein